MGYPKIYEILPKEIILQIQDYIEGAVIYIPKRSENKKLWGDGTDTKEILATVYKGNIIKNLIMDCQSYTKYRPNETTGGIFVSWRRKEELPTGA